MAKVPILKDVKGGFKIRHTKYDILKTNYRLRISKPRYCFCRKEHGGGFTIVELLIALAIASMLLASIAVAINASIINYRENEDMFKVINSARQALLRMTTQLRTGDNVSVSEPNNRCSFFTAENKDITYEYRSADNKLYLITNDDLTDPDYVLCDNVTAMTFTKAFTDDGTDCKSVQVSITVAQGNAERKISAAAVIRRNLDW